MTTEAKAATIAIGANKNHGIYFIPSMQYEKLKSTDKNPSYYSFHCRESYVYRIFEHAQANPTVPLKYTLSFTMPSCPMGKLDTQYVVDLVKLLDIFVGCVGIYVVPSKVLKKAAKTEAGNFTIDEKGVFTYLGIAPEIYAWHVALTSLLLGTTRTAIAILDTPQAKELFLGDKTLSGLARLAIDDKDKKIAAAVLTKVQELMKQITPGARLLTRPIHWKVMEYLRKGYVRASDSDSNLNWTQQARTEMQGFGINGFASYSAWIKRRGYPDPITNYKLYKDEKIPTYNLGAPK